MPERLFIQAAHLFFFLQDIKMLVCSGQNRKYITIYSLNKNVLINSITDALFNLTMPFYFT